MAEKGAEGFSLPSKAVKSSLKSTTPKGPLKGKDDSSAKPKKGRKVQFESKGSAEPKFDFPSKFGAGIGDKVPNAPKTSASKVPQPLELKMEQELPKNVKCQCIMDCEAAQILGGIQDQMVLLSADPTIRIPVSFDRGLQYAKRGSHYTNPESVRQVLETLKKHGVTDGEICVIANVFPETTEEVFSLVPSLKAKRSELSEPLKDVLRELVKFKQSS